MERPIKVLILSDRLTERARVLAEYLRSTENFHVVGLAADRNQTMKLAEEHSFDFLIIAGYLRKRYNYEVIAELQNQGRSFVTVQWAMLDSLIAEFCRQYNIQLRFERTEPLEAFAGFLMDYKR